MRIDDWKPLVYVDKGFLTTEHSPCCPSSTMSLNRRKFQLPSAMKGGLARLKAYQGETV